MNSELVSPEFILKILAAIGGVIAMLMGMHRTMKRLESQDKGFGPNTIKALAVVMFLPILLILAVTVDIDNSALMALLGAVAGYLLSNTDGAK